jgi:hypothetical protein
MDANLIILRSGVVKKVESLGNLAKQIIFHKDTKWGGTLNYRHVRYNSKVEIFPR